MKPMFPVSDSAIKWMKKNCPDDDFDEAYRKYCEWRNEKFSDELVDDYYSYGNGAVIVCYILFAMGGFLIGFVVGFFVKSCTT